MTRPVMELPFAWWIGRNVPAVDGQPTWVSPTDTQRLLAYIATNPGHSSADAARAGHISHAMRQKATNNLLRCGFITAARLPGARHKLALTATEAGRGYLANASHAVEGAS